MIEFATLLLGLVTGPRWVEVALRPPVAAVEIWLDGQEIGELTESPWRFEVDLGEELSPHELVAVGLDESGSEVARTGQWINLPRGGIEARWIMEAGEGGWPRAAHLVWASVRSIRPSSMRVLFDGSELPVEPGDRVSLPEYPQEQLHVLTAELSFPSGEKVEAEAIFGGGFGERVTSDLTAVPVIAEAETDPPTLEAITGAFAADTGPLDVVSLDRSGADVVVVTDLASRLAARDRIVGVEIRMKARFGQSAKDLLPLGREDRIRFVWPVVSQRRQSGGAVLDPSLFPARTWKVGPGLGLQGILMDAEQAPAPQRVADAVAYAGVAASAGNRPRAVVLMIDPATPDDSAFTPREVRSYLARLHVPLEVWTFAEDPGPLADDWGEVESVAEWKRFRGVVRLLREALEHQSVVWVGGSHLPQTIRLADGVRGFEIAGAE